MRITIVIIFFIFSLKALGDQSSRATEIFNNVKNSFSSSEAVINNLQNPLTSNVSMTTLDGTKSFDAQLSCNAQSEYLEVSVYPTHTNDVTIRAAIDSNLDGTWDHMRFITNVSGVCQNGYVSCDEGTWNNCDYYLLDATDIPKTTKLTTPDSQSQLFDCECINNSCGENLAEQNKDRISRKVASRLSVSMSNHDPRYIASKVKTENGRTTFSGNDVSSCSSATSNNTAVSDLVYAANNKDLDSLVTSGNSTIEDQSENSPFSLAIQQQNNGYSNGSAVQNCSITRELKYEESSYDQIHSIIMLTPLGQGGAVCDYDLLSGVATCGTATINNSNYTEESLLYFKPFNYSELCSNPDAFNIRLITDAWGALPFTSSAEFELLAKERAKLPSTLEGTHLQTPTCENNLTGRVVMSPNAFTTPETDFYFSRIIFSVNKSSCELKELVNSTCSGIDINSCKLSDEIIDGVETYSKTLKTDKTSLPSSVLVENGTCSSLITREWHNINRTYFCTDSETLLDTDFSHLQEPTISGDSMIVNGIEGESIELTKPDLPLPSCQKSCEVSKEVLDDQTNLTGQTSDGRNIPTRTLKIFKSCEDNLCPLEAGETLTKACACGGNFGQAATSMQMLRMAGQDMRCSDE